MSIRMIVHGGAWNIPDALWSAHRQGCEKAYKVGHGILEAGGSALEAVAAAIRILEDDPTFDAGYGSFLNEDGTVALDAGLMDGKSLRSGAVLGVSKVKNPIDLAHHVLTDSEHCLFFGDGAHRMAEKAGFSMVDPARHIHPREQASYERIQAGDRSHLKATWRDRPAQGKPGDTVGAIALDHEGNLAAGNSTGGTPAKAVGRVGDAALIGAGFYADNKLGAVICTGWGESLMRAGVAMRALHNIGEIGPDWAAREAIEHLQERIDGYGGILVMAPDGSIGAAYNTGRLACRLPQPFESFQVD